jgi:hypothetical protein
METHKVFCSACDREVTVTITDAPSQDGHANLYDSEVVCLEIGERCTGILCPVGATAPAVMAARLVHTGLQTPTQLVVPFDCARCFRVTNHVLIDRRFATCGECGATSERSFEIAS